MMPLLILLLLQLLMKLLLLLTKRLLILLLLLTKSWLAASNVKQWTFCFALKGFHCRNWSASPKPAAPLLLQIPAFGWAPTHRSLTSIRCESGCPVYAESGVCPIGIGSGIGVPYR